MYLLVLDEIFLLCKLLATDLTGEDFERFTSVDKLIVAVKVTLVAGKWEKNEPPHDKTNKMTCAPSEKSDQTGHPPSLISVRCPHGESMGP